MFKTHFSMSDINSIDSSSSSVLVDSRVSDSPTILPPQQNVSIATCEGDSTEIAKEILSKWYVFDSFEWTTNHDINTSLKRFLFPGILSTNDCLKDSNLRLLLKPWTYMKCDVEFKFQLNANKFQVGCLQISSYYAPNLDSNLSQRNNIFSRSQMPHCLLNAQDSSGGVLSIPYFSVKPYFDINDADEQSALFEINTLVLNKLTSVSTTFNSVNVSCLIRFTNVSFHGLTNNFSFAPDSPCFEMFSMLKDAGWKAAEGALKQFFPDLNRDKPTDISPASSVVPTSAHSWANGTNTTEKINVLRLDPTSTVPHAQGVKVDEMQVSHISSFFCLIKQVKWKVDKSRNANLFTWPIAAIAPIKFYNKASNEGVGILASYNLPAVSVLACNYAYWRGSMEFRFDVVCSQFHSGRLFVCYLPKGKSDMKDQINLNKAANLYNAVFDIQDGGSFTFNVPFVYDRQWCKTYETCSPTNFRTVQTGCLYCIVQNALIPMDSVPNEISINVYQRGGKDFELAVPIAPVLGLAWDLKYFVSKERISKVAPGFEQVILDTWRFCFDGKYLICRYGELSDQVTQFTKSEYGALYRCENCPIKAWADGSATEKVYKAVEYLYCLKSDDTYFYMLPVKSLDYVQRYMNRKDDTLLVHAFFSANDTSIEYFDMTGKELQWMKASAWKDYPNDDPNDLPVEHNMDSRERSGDSAIPISVCPSPLNLTFNENFMDLKNVVRRYQLYDDVNITVKKDGCYGKMLYRVPLTPSGLMISASDDKCVDIVFDRMRNGTIPILSSCFRFYRGSQRFRFLFTTTGSSLPIVSLVHVPEMKDKFKYRSEVVKASSYLDYISSGYAYYGQSTKLNQILEVEIPYYAQSDFSLLQRNVCKKDLDNMSYFFSNGYIGLSLMNEPFEDCEYKIQMYQSMGDDMRFYNFCGFPPVVFINTIPAYVPKKKVLSVQNVDSVPLHSLLRTLRVNYKFDNEDKSSVSSDTSLCVEHEMLKAVETRLTSSVDEVKTAMIASVSSSASVMEEAVVSMTSGVATKISEHVDSITQNVNDSVNNINSNVQETLTNFNHSSSQVFAKVDTTVSGMQKLFDSFSGLLGDLKDLAKDYFRTLVVHVTSVLVTPSIKNIVVQTLGFFYQIGLFSFETIGKLTSGFISFFSKILPKKQTEEVIEHNADFCSAWTAEDSASLTATCIAGIASVFGLTRKNFTNIPDFFSFAFKDMKDFAMTANHLSIFFKSNINFFHKCYIYVASKMFPELSIVEKFQGESQEVLKWVERSSYLTDSRNKSTIKNNPVLQKEVFEHVVIGMRLCSVSNHSSTNRPIYAYMARILAHLQKLQEELVSECLAPPVRFEPWIFHLVGQSNIGKSFVVGDITRELLKNIGYRSYSELIYTRTPGNKYWNGVNNQPCLLYDDWLATKGETGDMQVEELFALKSCAPFNPPIAEIENKKKKYNPLLVFLASNAAFPKPVNVNTIGAFWRRRDIMVEASLLPIYKEGGIRSVPACKKKTFAHLRFRFYDSVTDDANIKFSEYHDYTTFLNIVKNQFKKYYEAESLKYKDRLDNLTALYPDDESLSVEEILERGRKLIDTKVEQQQLMLSKQLKEWMKEIRTELDENPLNIIDHNMLSDSDSIEVVETEAEIHNRLFTENEKIIREPSCNCCPPEAEAVQHDRMYKESLKSRECYLKVCDCCSDRSLVNSSYDSGSSNFSLHPNLDTDLQIFNRMFPDYEETFSEKCRSMLVSNPGLDRCVHPLPSSFYIVDAVNPSLTTIGMFEDEDGSYPEVVCNDNCKLLDKSYMKSLMITQITTGGIGTNGDIVPDRVPIIFRPKLLAICAPPVSVNIFKRLLAKFTIPESIKKFFSSKLGAIYRFFKHPTVISIIKGLGVMITVAALASTIFGCVDGAKDLPDLRLQPLANKVSQLEREIEVKSKELAEKSSESQWIRGLNYTHPNHESWKFKSTWGVKRGSANRSQIRASMVARQVKSGKLVHNMDLGESSARAVIKKIFMRNAGQLHIEDGNNLLGMHKFIALAGTYILVTKHFYENLIHFMRTNKNSKLFFMRPDSKVAIDVNHCLFKCFHDSSLCIMKLPSNIPMFPDIRHWIANEKQHQNMTSEAMFLEYQAGYLENEKIDLEVRPNITIQSDGVASSQILDNIFTYGVAGKGRCGSVIISLSPEVKIVGIHVAGTDKTATGYGEPIFFEYFEELKCHNVIDHDMLVPTDEIAPRLAFDSDLMELGCVPRRLEIHQPRRSQLVPSLAYDKLYPHTTEPAPLDSKDPRLPPDSSPLRLGIEKHGDIPLEFPQDLLERAFNDLNDKILGSCTKPLIHHDNPVLSDKEVFEGIPGLDGFTPLELRTSEGYPLIHQRPKGINNKKWLFDFDEVGGVKVLKDINPALKSLIVKNSVLRANGTCADTIFVDSLKDERKSIAKCRIPGSTRVFSISPVEYTMAIKKYFGLFQASFQHNRLRNECALGINPDGPEWAQVVHHLVGPHSNMNFITGDYSAFGDKLQSSCVKASFQIIINWYKKNYPVDAHPDIYSDIFFKIQECLVSELLHVQHLALNLVYRMYCGIPSGFALTVELNSLVNCLYFRVAWLEIMQDTPWAGLDQFNKFCRLLVYGDDCVCSVHDTVKDFFNFVTLHAFFKKYNIRFTPASKKEEDFDRPFDDLENVTFLKRHFRNHPTRPSMYLAPLPEDSVKEMINWRYSTNDPRDSLMENLRASNNAMYGWGPVYHHNWRCSLIDLHYKINKDHLHVATWKEIDDRIFGIN